MQHCVNIVDTLKLHWDISAIYHSLLILDLQLRVAGCYRARFPFPVRPATYRGAGESKGVAASAGCHNSDISTLNHIQQEETLNHIQ